jgi:glycosyltransferase involved in cell wall biosynthesis
MNISIILSTYNWPNALKIILKALIPQILKQTQHNIEIIIADDGSDNVTRSVVNEFTHQYSFIKHMWHEDIGFRKSKILNKAVSLAIGEYLLFLDGDCIPFPDYIEEQIFLIENGYMVAGHRILLAEKITKQILLNPTIINNIVKWRLFNWLYARIRNHVNKIWPNLRLGNGKWRYFNDQNWKYPKGCNFAVWKNDFLAVNGFDESFEGWGHEDSDLFIRLLHYGIRFKNGKFSIPVLHLWHKIAKRDNVKTNWQILSSRAIDHNFIKATIGVEQYI